MAGSTKAARKALGVLPHWHYDVRLCAYCRFASAERDAMKARFDVLVVIDNEKDLAYHGVTLNEASLQSLIADAVYLNTNSDSFGIHVSVIRLGERETDPE